MQVLTLTQLKVFNQAFNDLYIEYTKINTYKLARRLKLELDCRRIKLVVLAKEMSINYNTLVSYFKTNGATIPFVLLVRICYKYNIDISMLLDVEI